MIALLLLLPATLVAQAPTPLFRAKTQLVEFTLVALDKHGNAVTDLRKEELQVFADGKPADIAFFRFEGQTASAPEPATMPLAPGYFSNRVEYTPGPPRNISAIVLDTLNTEPSQMMWVRAQVTRYLRKLAPQTRIAVFHLGSKITVLHDFTDDVESLRRRVEKAALPLPPQSAENIDSLIRDAEQMLDMFPDFPDLREILTRQIEIAGVYNASMRRRRLETTLAALESLGQHLSGIPGRKNLVWIGGGISMLNITGAMGFGVYGGIESHENPVRQAAQRLAQKNIALYAVDARAFDGPKDMAASISRTMPVRGRGRFEPQQQTEEISADPLPAAFKMADITGGRVIQNTNNPAEGMDRAAKDQQGAYSLGFYALDDPDGKWHGLKVKVQRSGLRMTHRQGFLAVPPASIPALWSSANWQAAIHNPLGSTAISLDARCEPAETGESGTLTLFIQIEPSHLYFSKNGTSAVAELEIVVAEKKAAGAAFFHQEAGRFNFSSEAVAGSTPLNCRWSKTWKPGDDFVSLRIIVLDRSTGRYGTLDLLREKIPGRPVREPAGE